MIDNIKNNKKVIVICLVFIVLVVLIYFLTNKLSTFNENEIYERVEITKYEANQYIPVYMTNDNMATKYLNDFKNLVLTDANEAYNVLNQKYRNKKFNDIYEFYQYIENLDGSLFYSLKVEKYMIKNSNGYKFFDIYASDGNRYIFKELSIMNYEVYLDDFTIEIE